MQNRNDTRKELIRYASLTHQDIEQIHQCRRDYNRLGFGYQIGVVRFFNRFPTQQPLEIIPDLLTFISVQLQIDENLINQYQRRRQTISQHQVRIKDYLKLQIFDSTHRELLARFLFKESCRLEQTNALLYRAEQFLRENRILRPATSTLERIIGEQRTQARQHIFEQITDSLSEDVKEKLDTLLIE